MRRYDIRESSDMKTDRECLKCYQDNFLPPRSFLYLDKKQKFFVQSYNINDIQSELFQLDIMLKGCRGEDFETTQFEEKVCSAKPSIFYSALRRPQQNLFIISNIHHLAGSARQSTTASSLYSHKKSGGF